jgi:hypothetical protein
MKWLRKLFASSPAPATVWEAESPDPIDWKVMEEKLFDLCEKQISVLAATQPEEVFYGIGLDCSAESGEVLIHANTENSLVQTASESMQRSPQYYVGKSIDEVVEELRWGFGEWKYHAFNLEDPSWPESWGEAEELVSNSTNIFVNNRKWPEMDAAKEDFMKMTSRVALRLRASSSVNSLARAANFSTLCAEHDEGPDHGFDRMNSLSDT